MSNRIIIPFLNSVKWVEQSPATFPQYDKPLFDYSLFRDQLQPFQEQKCYAQKRTIYDADKFQFIANYDPIQIDFIRKEDDSIVFSVGAQNIRRNRFQPDYYIYEVDVSYAGLDAGLYYMRMNTGSDAKIFVSENIEICGVEQTVLLEYAHSEYYGEVVWETLLTMAMRVEGVIGGFTPGNKSVVYEDQVLNNSVLSYLPYRTFKLFIGGSFGVPDYIVDKLNRIMGCDNLRVNGMYVSVPDGSKWEKNEFDYYPLRGWTIELREALNRVSSVFDTETTNGKKLLVAHNIESKGFGDLSENAGSNLVVITDIE